MILLLLVLGFVLMLTAVLGQVYSLKTKRGVLPPETPNRAPAYPRSALYCRPGAGLDGGSALSSPLKNLCPALLRRGPLRRLGSLYSELRGR